jgi:hypothetical protein
MSTDTTIDVSTMSVSERRSLAWRIDLTPALFERLADDPDEFVRRAIAERVVNEREVP